jgi:hypothetical protein
VPQEKLLNKYFLVVVYDLTKIRSVIFFMIRGPYDMKTKVSEFLLINYKSQKNIFIQNLLLTFAHI